ncbi:MAG TPA: DUF2884 family protein [Luteibacter sp.]|uniref:DUF2884 family protein n=1 Tax=Luteibacter sp. TaxID=1886636 RepID=UPI002CD719E3|nr:DUF2884 family protein [Luteibacter sp.]HVI54611.1 DUF2884 family protein [Luteibacter sp.]
MRHPIIAGTAVFAFALAATAAQATDLNFNSDTCKHDYSTPYDVDVTAAGLSFHRTDGTPAEIFLHDGGLRVDGKDIAVSRGDADALRRYEAGVRALMPQVAAIARDGVELGFSAMTTVTLSFADGDQRGRMLEKLKRKQVEALREIDEGVGSGHWSSNRMTETVAGSVSDSVGELVGSVTSSAVTAALSGDASKVAALQARADSLDKAMDREMSKRSKALEAKSNAICPQLNDLASLQQGWGVRLANGKPLELMAIKPKGEHHGSDHDHDSDHKVVSF